MEIGSPDVISHEPTVFDEPAERKDTPPEAGARGKLGYTGSMNDEHAFRRDKKPLCALSGSGFESGRDVLDAFECPAPEALCLSDLLLLPLL